MKFLFVMILFLGGCITASGQKEIRCKQIYTSVEKEAFYGKSPQDFMRYLEQNFSIDSICINNGLPEFYSLRVKLLIDYKGSLKDVEIISPDLSYSCKLHVKSFFTSMQKWTPAYLKGKPVCSYVIQTIACLKWE